MKQFNLEEYLKNPSRKVVTRNGRNVRILCTDAKGDYPIVTLMETFDGSIEFVNKFKKDGHFLDNDDNDSNLDLFFAPEKHEGWINIFRNFGGNNYLGDCSVIKSKVYESKENAEKEGNKCLGYITTIKIEWEE